jgi:DNA-binding response OmpR family regulator
MADILVIEDDDLVRDLLIDMLKRAGHRVTAFDDAAPALRSVELQRADLIITDLSMPTPGDQAIRMMRAMDIQAPILVVSGQITEQKEAHLYQWGAQVVMRKPFLMAEFFKQVNRLIKIKSKQKSER